MDESRHGTGPKKIRILLVDDHAILRHGLKMLIDSEPDMLVVDQAGGGREALTLAMLHNPDVVVMDISMPDGNGLDATELIRRACPESKVVVLSRHADPTHARRLFEAGATGYVVKKTSAAALVQAIRVVASSGTYIDAAMTPHVATAVFQIQTPQQKRSSTLTEREAQVLREVARGRTNKEIAQMCEISVKTVEAHKARSCAKLGLLSRADIVKYAIRENWMDD